MVTSGDAGRIVVGILMIVLGLVWALMALANVILLIKVDGGAACGLNVAIVHVLGANLCVNPRACFPIPVACFWSGFIAKSRIFCLLRLYVQLFRILKIFLLMPTLDFCIMHYLKTNDAYANVKVQRLFA